MNIGRKIYGYCDGYFGRDDYENKIIILEGDTWIVCAYLRCRDNNATCVNFKNEQEKQDCINRWSKYDEEDYGEN